MAAVPEPRRVYVGGPSISPPYLVGRRILVERVLTVGDVTRISGHRHVACTDDDLRRGLPIWTKPDPACPSVIHAKVVVRGKVRPISINVESWDGARV